MFYQARFEFEIDRVHEVIEDDELRVHLRVRFERRVPVALGLLQRDKRVLSAIDRVVKLAGELVAGRNRDRRTVYFNCLSHKSPALRTWLRPVRLRVTAHHGVTAHLSAAPRSSIANTS